MSHADELEIRAATPEDDAAVLDLLAATLGWSEGGVEEQFFHWKHRQNPFGSSPAWVALDGDKVVGYRTFLRWEFLDDDGRTRRAVRAVDTVTDVDYRGRGIFRSLTLHGVAALTLDRTHFVFNTPNDSSRPGYLSMGWLDSCRVPIGMFPRGVGSLPRILSAREPAQLWSEPCDVGVDAADAFRADEDVDALLRHAPHRGVRTRRDRNYLRWRTIFPALRYRVLLADDGQPDRGGVVFRLRRRGAALEATVVETFISDQRLTRCTLRRLLTLTGADYAIAARRSGQQVLIPLPGQGPRLTTRTLSAAAPRNREWRLSLADIELF